MRIDQDTFKDGELNYGKHGSEQRERLYEWRWQKFIDVITHRYPEYFLMFYSHKRIRQHYLNELCKNIDFRMKSKLKVSLVYTDLESINSNEFTKIIAKLANYIKQGGNVEEEVKKTFTQPLPSYLQQYHQ